MTNENALKIPGWMTENELSYLAQAAGKSKRILEIGSWMGRSTLALAENTTGIVYALDTWGGDEMTKHLLEGREPDWLFQQFKTNTCHCRNIIPIQNSSLAAAKEFQGPGFDMIFIDAAHDYESVKQDIIAWAPWLLPNGIFCGHDFSGAWPGVMQAVRESIQIFKTVDTIWTTEVG